MGLVLSQRRRQGIAAVEMAVVAPFLLLLLAGIWEVGQVLNVQDIMDNAAREGGRLSASAAFFASNNHTDPSSGQPLVLAAPSTNIDFEVQQKILLYLTAAGFNTTGATVQINNISKGWNYTYTAAGTSSGSGFDPAAAADQLDHLRVTVTLPYSSVQWSTLGFFFNAGTTLSASSDWYSMRNVPLLISATIPPQPVLQGQPLP